jgi:hypothetical protein
MAPHSMDLRTRVLRVSRPVCLRSTWRQNFTTDKVSLNRAIDSGAFGTNKRAEGRNGATATAVFLIGERVKLAPTADFCNSYLEPATRRMLSATHLANVTVNTIDPNTLETTNVHAGDDFRPDRPVSEQATAQEKADRSSFIERQQSLQAVADATGGRAILNTNRPEESVRSILEESSAYYLVAFQVSDVKADGRFHPVSVKVSRPGLQVRTRKGYYADAVARGDAGAIGPVPLEDVSRALLPERGIPMTVTVAPFRDTATAQTDVPRLEDLLQVAGAYVAGYEQNLTLVAEEDYSQQVTQKRRTLHSDILITSDHTFGWLEFRDVAVRDGSPMRDHQERLLALFTKPNPDRLTQAQRIVAEGARFNLSPPGVRLNRTINMPLTAARFLRPADQYRSSFRIAGPM